MAHLDVSQATDGAAVLVPVATDKRSLVGMCVVSDPLVDAFAAAPPGVEPEGPARSISQEYQQCLSMECR